jgi:superoxide dismutase
VVRPALPADRKEILIRHLVAGGHLNHSLFWENLAPKNQGGGDPPSGALAKAIDDSYGSLDELKKKFNAALAGIQGSGWAWLVQDTQTGNILIKTYAVSASDSTPMYGTHLTSTRTKTQLSASSVPF